MKKYLLVSLLVVSSAMGLESEVFADAGLRHKGIGLYDVPGNTKAMKDFRKRFSMAKDEKWHQYKKVFAVSFATDDINYRVEYDGRGNWRGTEKDYTEAKLDRKIRKIVKMAYFECTISWIREITVPEFDKGPVYLINIEHENSIKILTVYDDEVKVLEEYQKS
jgi:hypothetical protein